MAKRKILKIRALRTLQGEGVVLYSFFLQGSKIYEIAKISRIQRDEDQKLVGFQRKEIKSHVKQITEYLDRGNVLFPNAIIVAMSSSIEFKRSRGRKYRELSNDVEVGILELPIFETGQPVAWIVDGQQRTMALTHSKNSEIPVPIIAFISDDLEVQREQFILVNKARPLPTRLINELLPVVPSFTLPRDLSSRRIPSELCNLLNTDRKSPFFKLIKRVSTDDKGDGVVTDTAMIHMMRRSIKNPLGALAPYKGNQTEGVDLAKMYQTLIMFWQTVKEVFSDAWGLPPTRSRLMHSAGISAMGVLMDRVIGRAMSVDDPEGHVRKSLRAIAPYCRWTDGVWETVDLQWNEIQNISRHIKLLSDALIQLDYKCLNAR